jgi:hypothetical protein
MDCPGFRGAALAFCQAKSHHPYPIFGFGRLVLRVLGRLGFGPRRARHHRAALRPRARRIANALDALCPRRADGLLYLPLGGRLWGGPGARNEARRPGLHRGQGRGGPQRVGRPAMRCHAAGSPSSMPTRRAFPPPFLRAAQKGLDRSPREPCGPLASKPWPTPASFQRPAFGMGNRARIVGLAFFAHSSARRARILWLLGLSLPLPAGYETGLNLRAHAMSPVALQAGMDGLRLEEPNAQTAFSPRDEDKRRQRAGVVLATNASADLGSTGMHRAPSTTEAMPGGLSSRTKKRPPKRPLWIDSSFSTLAALERLHLQPIHRARDGVARLGQLFGNGDQLLDAR